MHARAMDKTPSARASEPGDGLSGACGPISGRIAGLDSDGSWQGHARRAGCRGRKEVIETLSFGLGQRRKVARSNSYAPGDSGHAE
jgi:hypothetical protein